MLLRDPSCACKTSRKKNGGKIVLFLGTSRPSLKYWGVERSTDREMPPMAKPRGGLAQPEIAAWVEIKDVVCVQVMDVSCLCWCLLQFNSSWLCSDSIDVKLRASMTWDASQGVMVWDVKTDVAERIVAMWKKCCLCDFCFILGVWPRGCAEVELLAPLHLCGWEHRLS